MRCVAAMRPRAGRKVGHADRHKCSRLQTCSNQVPGAVALHHLLCPVRLTLPLRCSVLSIPQNLTSSHSASNQSREDDSASLLLGLHHVLAHLPPADLEPTFFGSSSHSALKPGVLHLRESARGRYLLFQQCCAMLVLPVGLQ